MKIVRKVHKTQYTSDRVSCVCMDYIAYKREQELEQKKTRISKSLSQLIKKPTAVNNVLPQQ